MYKLQLLIIIILPIISFLPLLIRLCDRVFPWDKAGSIHNLLVLDYQLTYPG